MTRAASRFSPAFLLGVALLCVLGCSGDNKEKKDKDSGDRPGPGGGQEDLSKVKPDFSLTAKQFSDEFKKDEQAAKAKYNGKVIELAGVVESIMAPSDGVAAALHLEVGKAEPIADTVACHTSDKAPWKKVTPGQSVKVRGRSAGFGLKNCSIAEVTGQPSPTLTAAQFAKEREKHKNKWVILTGDVGKIESEPAGTTIILKTDGMEPAVSCTFSLLNAGQVQGLQVGQRVKILGKYSPIGSLELVLLTSCIRVE